MPTNSFDRKFEITDPEVLKKLIQILSSDPPATPLSEHPYSQCDRKRSVLLLKQCLER